MMFKYDDTTHTYTLDGVVLPSLTEMLTADGLNDDLKRVDPSVVRAKAEWGSRLHLALLRAEYGDGIDKDFKQHCVDWLDTCRRMKWNNPNPIWFSAEKPLVASCEGFLYGFTPDRLSRQAVVEIKGTYSPSVSHDIQTALQVLGVNYPRDTPRWIAYFDRDGLKKLHHCQQEIRRYGSKVDVFEEAERIIFERAWSAR